MLCISDKQYNFINSVLISLQLSQGNVELVFFSLIIQFKYAMAIKAGEVAIYIVVYKSLRDCFHQGYKRLNLNFLVGSEKLAQYVSALSAAMF